MQALTLIKSLGNLFTLCANTSTHTYQKLFKFINFNVLMQALTLIKSLGNYNYLTLFTLMW